MSSEHASRCSAFRDLHRRGSTFVIPNPWDAGSARILAHAGFRALATTSAGLAYSMGRLDGMVTRDEVLANARDIVAATPLPVSADLENCYGHGPATVAETIELAFGAGLCGASVEDFSGDPDNPIYAHDHAVARVAAAARAAASLPYPFVVTARAEGFLHGQRDLAEVVGRLRAFEAAGADVVFAPGLPDLEAIRTAAASVSCPLNVLVAGRDPHSVGDLREAGVVRVSLGALVTRAAFGSVYRAAREVIEHGTFGFVSDAMPSRDVDACMAGREPARPA